MLTRCTAEHSSRRLVRLASPYPAPLPCLPAPALRNPANLACGSARVATATRTPCPEPRLLDYTNVGRPPEFNAFCDGDVDFNGFYGHGIVNALRAVSPSSGPPED